MSKPWNNRTERDDDDDRSITEILHGVANSSVLLAFEADALDAAANAIDAIHEILDGEEWSADTAPAIAEVILSLGFKIADPNDVE